jgi:hypothetical protein
MLRGYLQRFAGNLEARARAELIRETCIAVGPACEAQLGQWYGEGGEGSERDQVAAEIMSYPDSRSEQQIIGLGSLFAAPGPGEILSAERALQLTADYRTLYSHGIPFSPEALAGAWRACRADLRSRDECEILAQQQIEASLTSTPPEFETLVGQCMETRLTSLHCQAGAQQAEEMLKSGALPKLLEAQQIFETVR